MKTMILITFFFFLSCKEKQPYQSKTVVKEIIDRQIYNDIYIGKKFYEYDELNNYEYYSGGILSKDSTYNYSIYENEYKYVYSLEKQISFIDLREFLILDTLLLKKKKISNLMHFSYPLKNQKILSYYSNNSQKKIFVDSIFKSIIKKDKGH